MKLWIDDVRPAPKGYLLCTSVNQARQTILTLESLHRTIDLLDVDHDAGDYARDGGDYIRLLDWLEETGRSYPIRIHSMNVVGRANMERIIQRNNWKEIF